MSNAIPQADTFSAWADKSLWASVLAVGALIGCKVITGDAGGVGLVEVSPLLLWGGGTQIKDLTRIIMAVLALRAGKAPEPEPLPEPVQPGEGVA